MLTIMMEWESELEHKAEADYVTVGVGVKGGRTYSKEVSTKGQ